MVLDLEGKVNRVVRVRGWGVAKDVVLVPSYRREMWLCRERPRLQMA